MGDKAGDAANQKSLLQTVFEMHLEKSDLTRKEIRSRMEDQFGAIGASMDMSTISRIANGGIAKPSWKKLLAFSTVLQLNRPGVEELLAAAGWNPLLHQYRNCVGPSQNKMTSRPTGRRESADSVLFDLWKDELEKELTAPVESTVSSRSPAFDGMPAETRRIETDHETPVAKVRPGRRLLLSSIAALAVLGTTVAIALGSRGDDGAVTSDLAVVVSTTLPPAAPPASNPDAEIEAFIARLAANNPFDLLADAKDRLSADGDLAHIHEMVGIAQLELGFLNEAVDSFATASSTRRSAECYLALSWLQRDGVTDEALKMLGGPTVPDSASEAICLKAQVELALLDGTPAGDVMPTLQQALTVYPDDISLTQLAALVALEAGNLVDARKLAVRAQRLQPESVAANLTLTTVNISAAPPTTAGEWDDLTMSIEALMNQTVKGSRTYDQLNVALAQVLVFRPVDHDIDAARTILWSTIEDSLVPLQRHQAAVSLLLIESMAFNTGHLLPKADPDEMWALGENLLAEEFATLFTAAGYRALAIARNLDGRFIDGYSFYLRGEAVLKQQVDPFGGSTEMTGLPAGVTYGSSDPCAARPETTCHTSVAQEELGQHQLWTSEEMGDMFIELRADGTVVGAYTLNDGLIVGEIVGDTLRGRWCESTDNEPAPGPNGPLEFSFLTVNGQPEIDGRWLSEGHIDSTAWEEDWDLRPLSDETTANALAERVESSRQTCAALS